MRFLKRNVRFQKLLDKHYSCWNETGQRTNSLPIFHFYNCLLRNFAVIISIWKWKVFCYSNVTFFTMNYTHDLLT